MLESGGGLVCMVTVCFGKSQEIGSEGRCPLALTTDVRFDLNSPVVLMPMTALAARSIHDIVCFKPHGTNLLARGTNLKLKTVDCRFRIWIILGASRVWSYVP